MPRKSKLSDTEKAEIRRAYATGTVRMKTLAARYKVSVPTISRIVNET